MSPSTGSLPLDIVALQAVVSGIEVVEHRIRSAEAARAQLLAEALDIAAAATRDRITEVPSGPSGELAYRAVRAELATALGQSERTLERHLAQAYTLTRHYPRVFDAYGEGRISGQHAAVITQAGTVIGNGSDPDTIFRRAAYEEAVLQVAAAETPARLRPIAHRLAERYATVPLDERHAEARSRRGVSVQDAEDGMADLIAHLPAVEAYAIRDRLTRLSRHVEHAESAYGAACTPARGAGPYDGASAGGHPARRSRDEIRADLFTDLLLTSIPTGAPGHEPADKSEDGLLQSAAIRGHVQVLLPDHALEAPPSHATTEAPADTPAPAHTAPAGLPGGSGDPTAPPPPILAGYGPIDTTTAQQLAGHADHWETIRTTPDAHVLSVDRYRPSEAIRRYCQVSSFVEAVLVGFR